LRFHYQVKIAYKGTSYHGWQAQTRDPDNESLPTVQGIILRLLRRIARYPEPGRCTISGTSRTDAGVHACGQRAKISIPVDLDPHTLQRGLNSLLPASIRILECERCDASFHAKAGGTCKEYHYYFSCAEVPNPILGDVVAQIPGPLTISLMREAAALFVGEHDFYNYTRRSTKASTFIRTVLCCEVLALSPNALFSETAYLRVVGTGFLKQMIRYMASTLFAVGRGELCAQDVAESLCAHRDEKLCAKASACGLHLVSITDR